MKVSLIYLINFKSIVLFRGDTKSFPCGVMKKDNKPKEKKMSDKDACKAIALAYSRMLKEGKFTTKGKPLGTEPWNKGKSKFEESLEDDDGARYCDFCGGILLTNEINTLNCGAQLCNKCVSEQ